MPHNILIADADAQLCRTLAALLEQDGYNVTSAHTLAKVEASMARSTFAAIIMDPALPEGSGLIHARAHADQTVAMALIMTGHADPVDRILALEMGADDYLVKPFHPRELLARVHAVLRRTGTDRPMARIATKHTFGGFVIDAGFRTLLDSRGVDIPLTTQEFDVLYALVTNRQTVLDREQIVAHAGLRKSALQLRGIDGLISRLRAKLAAAGEQRMHIKTVHGRGYICHIPEGDMAVS